MKNLFTFKKISILATLIALTPTAFGQLKLYNNTGYDLNFSCAQCIPSTFTLTKNTSTSISSPPGGQGAFNLTISVFSDEPIGPYPTNFNLGSISWEGSSINATYCEVATYSIVSLLTGTTTLAGDAQGQTCRMGTVNGYSYTKPSSSQTQALLLSTLTLNNQPPA